MNVYISCEIIEIIFFIILSIGEIFFEKAQFKLKINQNLFLFFIF